MNTLFRFVAPTRLYRQRKIYNPPEDACSIFVLKYTYVRNVSHFVFYEYKTCPKGHFNFVLSMCKTVDIKEKKSKVLQTIVSFFRKETTF